VKKLLLALLAVAAATAAIAALVLQMRYGTTRPCGALAAELDRRAREATLGDALGFSGWSGKCGKARKLYRQAVTALLNAAHPDVNFPMDEDQVISTADIALLSCHNGTMNGQAADFEDVNEAGGCPFD